MLPIQYLHRLGIDIINILHQAVHLHCNILMIYQIVHSPLEVSLRNFTEKLISRN